MTGGTGNVTLNGAALVGGGSGSQGALAGAGTSSMTAANLTAEGTTDWIHWGDSSLNRKAGVSPLLSTYTVVGSGSVLTYSDDHQTFKLERWNAHGKQWRRHERCLHPEYGERLFDSQVRPIRQVEL